MAKHDKKGRRRGGASFLSLHHYMLRSAAWFALRPPERAVLLQIASRYRGNNNGYLVASIRQLALECHAAENTVTKSIKTLIRVGFIDRTQEGSFNLKVRHAAEFRLTWVSCDLTGHAATNRFMNFLSDGAET